MQVATLFRESSTLLGATMEGAELHGLKMAIFTPSDGHLKQPEAVLDDGYETSVDPLDVRPHSHTHSDSKSPDIEQPSQQPHSALPQMQQMQLVHGHHHFADQRLHARVSPESRISIGEGRLSLDQVEGNLPDPDHMTHDSRLSPGQESHGSHISSIERLSSHDSMEGINTRHDSQINAERIHPPEMSGHENHLNRCNSQIDLNDIDNRIDSHLENHENQMSNMENRINRERQHGIDNRAPINRDRLSIENRMTPQEHMDPRLSIENRMTPQEHMDHRLSLENRMTPSMDNRMEMDHVNRDRLSIENRMTPQDHMDPRLSIENRMTPHDHMDHMNRMTPQDHMNRGIENRLTPHEHRERMVHEQMEQRLAMESRMTPHEHMNNIDHRERHLAMNAREMEKRIPNHDIGAMDARMGSRMDDMSMDINGMNPRDLSMDSRMMAHENHMNNMAHGEMHHHENHGHMGHLDRHAMMSHENHMAAHMGHMNPHDHLQHHAHMQGLHHAHHGHPQHNHPQHHHPHHPHHPHIKCDAMDDPYSFVDEENGGMAAQMLTQQSRPSPVLLQTVPKKRGRKKKIKPEDGMMEPTELMKKENGLVKPIKERKKHDRFNGMPEEEVVKRTLPDHLTPNLDIVIVGINPGLTAAYKGHHYAGPGNHFWKCLYLSGLTPEPMTADDDYKLLQVGIGFTNMVARATKGSADLTRKEIKEGSQVLLEKLQKFKPKIAVFNGKLIYEVFSGNKDFHFGRQPDFVDGTNTYMWVMPSSSARCAQLPRAADKVPFYSALKKFRDYLNGLIADLDDNEVVFNDQKLKTFYESEVKSDNKDEHGNFFPYARNPNQELGEIGKKEPFDPNRPEKKKRGRPKKIRVEGEEPPPPKERVKKEKPPVDSDAPKKKRGRPKKIKTEDQPPAPPAPPPVPPPPLNVAEHTSSSNPTSACFSPPIQSPSGFCQGFSPAYTPQNQPPAPPQFAPRAPSPPPYMPSPHHPSPLPTQYSQSPPPTSQSQAYSHSDLSSEISAAISSEHLGSPPPTSPSLGPPDFEPPTSMPEDGAAMSAKEETEECRFPSPTPSESNAYQYRGFQESEDQKANFSRQPSPEFPQKRANQDVASKSLSGLESLVDQIPSIGDNGVAPAPSSSENFEAQPPGQYDDYMGYPGYSGPPPPHYTTSTNFSTTGYIPPTQSNFSVSSLANSSHEAQVASSFSVSSLASNYTPSGYPNLMGAPHLVVPQPGLFGSGMNMPANYQYPQYPSTPPTTFPYTPHALHVPSPNYPSYSPYSNSSYPQPYLANHVLDRIKQERMDIGFGGF